MQWGLVMSGRNSRNISTSSGSLSVASGFLTLAFSLLGQAATLEDLDFLDGHWLATPEGQRIEEVWLPSSGSTKAALFRWTQSDRTITIELVVVAAIEDRIELRFKHFDARFEPWEKDEPNTYRLVSAGNNKAVFERTSANTKVPAYMIYTRDGTTLRFRGTDNADASESSEDLVLVFECHDNDSEPGER